MRLISWTIIVSVSFAASTAAVSDQCPEFLAGQQVGRLKSNLVNEASGIAASRKNRAVLWVHNDSGGFARVFAVSTDGTCLGTYNLKGARCVDYEDIAIGPGPDPNTDYLYIGDIGDNQDNRSSVVVYRLPETKVDSNQPTVKATLTGVEAIRLQYPGKACDAETLMVDPITRDIYIISKQKKHCRLYRASYPQSTTEITMMEYKCQLPWGQADGGDISPDGSMVIVRSYFNASIWFRPAGTNLWEVFSNRPCEVPLIFELQGEAICFDATGCGYFTTSEGKYQPIYYFARDEKSGTKEP